MPMQGHVRWTQMLAATNSLGILTQACMLCQQIYGCEANIPWSALWQLAPSPLHSCCANAGMYQASSDVYAAVPWMTQAAGPRSPLQARTLLQGTMTSLWLTSLTPEYSYTAVWQTCLTLGYHHIAVWADISDTSSAY